MLGELASDAAREHRAVQFEFRVDTVRRAVMKVVDELQADDEVADRIHAEHHQRARDSRDIAAKGHVHRRIGEPEHLLCEREIGQHDLHERREVEIVVVDRRHRRAQ